MYRSLKKRCLFLPIVLFFFNAFSVKAQTQKAFSGDPVQFLKELRAYMELTNKQETERLLDAFELVWIEQPAFSSTQQSTVIRTANNMLKKRLKPYPDFSNYVKALMALKKAKQSDEVFTNWHNSLDEVLSLSSKRYGDFIEDVAGLFSDNILYASASTRWVAGPGYSFEFDSVPRIRFPKMDLKCFAKGDSSVIRGIEGDYYPLKRLFVGRGGRIDWQRAGLFPDSVYAELQNTEINTTLSDWTSENATFYNRQFFREPLTGMVTDKLLAEVTDKNVNYPRFSSYDLQLGIREIIRDADYVGGYAQHGNKMVGTGSAEQKATLTFKRDGKVQVVISSRNFIIRPERIGAEHAGFTCYHETDSIHHPDLAVRYVVEERTLTLTRSTQQGISMPFVDSWHQVDILVDAISWKIDDPLMEMKMTTGMGESKMQVESGALYTDERFQQIQGMADVSPLFTIKQYAEKNSRYIYPVDLSRFLRCSEQQARSLLIYLANKGLVSYDTEADVGVVNDKLYYYLAARSNKTDYDKIEIGSMISGRSNAKLNLLNFDLDLHGVGRVLLSDSQQVWIAPLEQELRLMKNRDMEFSGRVHAGRSDFFGKKFRFSYDGFRIDLPNIDSIRLKVVSDTELDENGNPKLISIRNTLQDVSGSLLIDSMMNKSGRKSFPGYPSFTSDKEAYLYYDHPSVYNAIYDRNRFYFKVDPFSIDSLDNFSSGGLNFKGVLESAGIFPPIRETAVIRPDYSFGFEQDVPTEGYAMYGGQGTYRQHIDLSFQGLVGSGEIDYLSSTTVSKDIVFFPDSTNLANASWDLRRETVAGTGFPQAEGRSVFVNWRPREGNMYVFRNEGTLSAYEQVVRLDGNAVLGTSGLRGSGVAYFQESELSSADFRFNQDDYGADSSDFRLKSDDERALAIQTRNVQSKIDLVKRVGSFSSNGKGSFVSFPLNQYICFIAQFKWFIDKQEVEFGEDEFKNTKLNIEGSDFVSTHPFQDSLRWNAGLARYSLTDYLIKARKVKEIKVADAVIYPNDTATIVVERNAVLRPLQEASITANTASRYHTIVEAEVNIDGRKRYEARGKYAYTDNAGTEHLIVLERVSVDTSGQSYANGSLSDSANFQISRNIQYKGRVFLAAANPLLTFDGFAKMSHRCEERLPANWFSFKGEIDPKGVNIPVAEPRNEQGERLSVSLCLSPDSTGFYSNFLAPKRRTADHEVVTASGFLSYDERTKRYSVAEPAAPAVKGKEEALPPPMLSLDDELCLVHAEGRFDFGLKLGQVKLQPAGTAVFNTNNDSMRFDLVMGMDFMFSPEALKVFSTAIQTNAGLKASNDSRPAWLKAVKSLIGREKADKLLAEYSLYGAPKKVPDDFQQSIVLSELVLEWDRTSQSYRSVGPIGVGFIGKEPIGRQLTGHLEIQRRRGVETLNLYLEADRYSWWYFNYSRGIMQAISSDAKFNDAIANLKPEKRVADTKKDQDPYEYMLSTDRKKAEFVRRMTPAE